MRNDFDLKCIEQLDLTELQPLLVESRTQGFKFLDTLVDEYASGVNRFALPGEGLFGLYNATELLAIGGLNLDPFLHDPLVGRVRHLYVVADWRRQGLGRALMEEIIHTARSHFRLLTLRTFSEPAARFYLALGFATTPPIPNATHHLQVTTEAYHPTQ
jgi:GNAT superfamily N-acetyltransferase